MLFNSKSSETYNSSLLAHAYNGKGFALAKKEDFSRAIICFNIAITIDKNYSAAIVNRANTLSEMGQVEESIKSYNQVSIDHDVSQFYLNNTASSLLKNSRKIEAIEHLDKSIALKKNTKEYYQALEIKAEILLQTEKYNDALSIVDQLKI